MCSLNSICNHGRTAVRRLCPLTCACPLREAHNRQGWAVGSLLSSSHSRVSFAIHVEHCHNNSGSLFVGVCDAVGQVGWGVCLWSGLVESFQCDPSRHVMSAHPRPVGLPHTNYEHGMKDAADQPEGGANGAVIEVSVDNGTLAFRVNGGPEVFALPGFPPGAVLRPWVCAWHVEDRVTLRGWLEPDCPVRI